MGFCETQVAIQALRVASFHYCFPVPYFCCFEILVTVAAALCEQFAAEVYMKIFSGWIFFPRDMKECETCYKIAKAELPVSRQ